MSSGKLIKDPKKFSNDSEINLQNEQKHLDISDLIIPFTKFSQNNQNQKEGLEKRKISFKKRDREFFSILRREFSDSLIH